MTAPDEETIARRRRFHAEVRSMQAELDRGITLVVVHPDDFDLIRCFALSEIDVLVEVVASPLATPGIVQCFMANDGAWASDSVESALAFPYWRSASDPDFLWRGRNAGA